MQTMKRYLLLALVPVVTAGCGVTVRNMTPQAVTRNPSGLYLVSVDVERPENSIVEGSVQPLLVLPDQTVPMLAVPNVSNRWEYTMAVPSNADKWPYYFKINFTREKVFSRSPRSQLDPTDAPKLVYVLYVTDRTAVGLDARRGRVGSTIKVLGRGFTSTDQVLFGGKSVPTRYENENSLSFQVPPVAGNQAYAVEVASGASKLKFGDLLVDQSQFVTSPGEAPIPFEAKAFIEIAIPQPAPVGGLPIKIEVSDPSLLQVPGTITIPEGQSRVQVVVQAKHLGPGALTLNADGFSAGTLSFRVMMVKSPR